jgi:hypothetical protein
MPQTLIYSSQPDHPDPSYTRLLATDPTGPHHGALFLVYDDGMPAANGLPTFPVYRSDDDGTSWHKATEIADSKHDIGHRYQPTMIELAAPVGEFPAGTLVAAGNAIPRDLSVTKLVVYASTDGAVTWQYLSDVDTGGPAIYDPSPDSTTTAIWEPELRQIGNAVVCYYSDERFKHLDMLQTLVHRFSSDLRTWGSRTLDFGVADRRTRPGMLVTTGPMPSGNNLGVLEIVGGCGVPVHLVRSTQPGHWGEPDSLGHALLSRTGTALKATPTISYADTPNGPVLLATGRVAVDAEGDAVNRALCSLDASGQQWTDVNLPIETEPSLEHDMAAYGQSLILTADGRWLVQAAGRRNELGIIDIIVATTPFNRPD